MFIISGSWRVKKKYLAQVIGNREISTTGNRSPFVVRPSLFAVRRPSSAVRPPSSVLRPPSSVLSPLFPEICLYAFDLAFIYLFVYPSIYWFSCFVTFFWLTRLVQNGGYLKLINKDTVCKKKSTT